MLGETAAALHVAAPKGVQHATVEGDSATPNTTANATTSLKALAAAVLERNACRNRPQQVRPTSATNTPREPHCMLHPLVVPADEPKPLRWTRFLALCVAQGVSVEQVRSMFTDRDIIELCEQDGALLPKFADTIVQAIKVASRNTVAAPTPRALQKRHRCGRCQHFETNPTSPSTGLGWCRARSDVGMGIPARLIKCDHYVQSRRS